MRFGESIVQLACHPEHQFHKQCYDEFVEYFEKQGTPLLCPLCRSPVDKSKVTEKKLAQLQDESQVELKKVNAADQVNSDFNDRALSPRPDDDPQIFGPVTMKPQS